MNQLFPTSIIICCILITSFKVTAMLFVLALLHVVDFQRVEVSSVLGFLLRRGLHRLSSSFSFTSFTPFHPAASVFPLTSADAILRCDLIAIANHIHVCIKATPLDFCRCDIAMRSDHNHTLPYVKPQNYQRKKANPMTPVAPDKATRPITPPSIRLIQRQSLLLRPQTNHALTRDHSGFPPITSATRRPMTRIARPRTFTASLPKAVRYIPLTAHFIVPARYLLCYSSARWPSDLSARNLTAHVCLLPLPLRFFSPTDLCPPFT